MSKQKPSKIEVTQANKKVVTTRNELLVRLEKQIPEWMGAKEKDEWFSVSHCGPHAAAPQRILECFGIK